MPVGGDDLLVEIDWDRNGNFTGTFDDVSSRLRGSNAGSVDVGYGREQPSAVYPTSVGEGRLVLDNRDKVLTPRNTASPLFGKVKPARPVRVRRTVTGSGTTSTYVLFYGHSNDQPLEPTDEGSVTTGLVDYLADFRGLKVSTALFRGERTGTLIGKVLDAVGWTGGRDLDPGATVVPYWWEGGTDALEALDRLLRAEGPPALLTQGTAGEIVFRDRHHRLFDATSATSQGVWRAAGAEPVLLARPFRADEAWSGIVNDASVTVDERQAQPLGVIWESDDPVVLDSGSYVVSVKTDEPFYGAVCVEGVDFVNLDGVPGGTVVFSRTSGQSFTLTITPTDVFRIAHLQVRGVSVPVVRTTTVSASDATSIADYGSRGLPFDDLGWATTADAQRILDTIVAQRKAPLTKVSCRFAVGPTAAGTRSSSAARANAVLARNLSDRVTLKVPSAALNGDFYVESIAHSAPGVLEHVVDFGLEAVPPDVAPVGTAVFRFDTSGQGFNQGRFA